MTKKQKDPKSPFSYQVAHHGYLLKSCLGLDLGLVDPVLIFFILYNQFC